MALTNKLNAIGNAIREKTGKTELLTLEQMPVEIASIQTGGGSAKRYQLIQSFTSRVTNATALTMDFTGVRVGNLLIVAFFIRGGSYTISEGWTDLGGSGTSVGSLDQRLCFCYKIVTQKDETLTITQTTSSRIEATGSEISGATSATLGESIADFACTISPTIPGGQAIYGAAHVSTRSVPSSTGSLVRYWTTNPVYINPCVGTDEEAWANVDRLFVLYSNQNEDIKYKITVPGDTVQSIYNIEFNYVVIN